MGKTTKTEDATAKAAPSPADELGDIAASDPVPPLDAAPPATGDDTDLRRACRQALAGCSVLERVNVEHEGQHYVAWFDFDFGIVVENRGA